MRSTSRYIRGLTVAEMIVTLFLFGLLSVLFLTVFSQVRVATGAGDKKVEFRGIHRKAQEQLAFYIRQMVIPDLESSALVSPTVGTTATSLVYNAPENHLDDTLSFDPRNPLFAEFTLRLDTSGVFYLQRTDLSGPLKTFGREISAVEFRRDQKSTIQVRMESQVSVKGAQNNDRTVLETTENYVYLPGAE